MRSSFGRLREAMAGGGGSSESAIDAARRPAAPAAAHMARLPEGMALWTSLPCLSVQSIDRSNPILRSIEERLVAILAAS